MNDVLLLSRAFAFASRRHVGQRRKGEAAEPYVNHLAEVAELVALATAGSDPALVAAALLHDTVEDTGTTLDDLRSQFGADVAALVAEVTDDKALPATVRKQRQIETAPHKSARAKLLKLADKTSNLRDIASSPPADWPQTRRNAYIAWARAVVDGLRGASPMLEAEFDAAVAAAERAVAA